MDFIFPVRALTSVTHPHCIYEGMGMHSWSTVVCQTWGQFCWNLVIYGSKCPILKGSIKRPNLQTADRYRAESFRVDSNMIGWSTCAVTRSDLMRVSHSWTSKLNILEILKHFWPASEPCIQATIKDMDFRFPVPALRSVTHPPCKYVSMDMQSWSTVVCQTLGQFRWNLVIYVSKCPILKGSIKRPNLQTADRYRAESFRVDSNMIGWSTSAVTRSNLMRVSHSWTAKLNILKILKHFWPAPEHCRQATISIWTLYFLCVP